MCIFHKSVVKKNGTTLNYWFKKVSSTNDACKEQQTLKKNAFVDCLCTVFVNEWDLIKTIVMAVAEAQHGQVIICLNGRNPGGVGG